MHMSGAYGLKDPLMVALLPADPNELVMRSLISLLIIIFTGYVQYSNYKLKQSANNLRTMLETTTDAYLELNYQAVITYINQRAREILKVEHNVVGKNVWSVFPEAVSGFYPNVEKVIKTREKSEFTSFYAALGRWLDVHAYPFENRITFYFRDITEQKLLLESNRRLNTIIGNASDGIITINQAGIIETFNEAAEDIFGYQHDEIIGKNITLLMARDEDVNQHADYIHHYLYTGDSKIIDIGPREVKARRKDGSVFPMDLAVSEMHFGDQHYFIGIVRDITDRQKIKTELEYLASYDALTNLPNRTLFSDRLNQYLKQAKRQQSMVSLLFIDLDDFKQVNDTLGHAAGDKVLIHVANKLKKCIRESDTVARLSGDEFAAILYPGHEAQDASRVAETVLAELSEALEINNKQVTVGCSIGISQYPYDAIDEESLLRCADIAMYRAKQQGKNSFVYYKPEMSGAMDSQ